MISEVNLAMLNENKISQYEENPGWRLANDISSDGGVLPTKATILARPTVKEQPGLVALPRCDLRAWMLQRTWSHSAGL